MCQILIHSQERAAKQKIIYVILRLQTSSLYLFATGALDNFVYNFPYVYGHRMWMRATAYLFTLCTIIVRVLHELSNGINSY